MITAVSAMPATVSANGRGVCSVATSDSSPSTSLCRTASAANAASAPIQQRPGCAPTILLSAPCALAATLTTAIAMPSPSQAAWPSRLCAATCETA